MTTLEAVNQILEGIGEPPASALDTGGTSEISEAEVHLDRANVNVQREGWACNTDAGYEMEPPLVKLGITGSSGTFEYDEHVTQSGSGFVGAFKYIASGFMYLAAVSGTAAASGTLTGADSAATRTTTSYTLLTESKMAVSDGWVSVQKWKGESKRVSVRGSFLYDNDELTDLFSSSVQISPITLLDFTDLPVAVQNYVMMAAKGTFQRYKKRGQVDESIFGAELLAARVAAKQEDSDQRGVNVLGTSEAMEIRGERWSQTTPVTTGGPI